MPQPPIDNVAGETIEIHGVPKENAVASTRADTFSQVIEVRKSGLPGLNEMRIITEIGLETDKLYLLNVRIPSDGYFLNPGSRNVPFGYAVEAEEISSASPGFFDKARQRINGFIKNNFSDESSPFLMSIITGERSPLTKETRDAFNVTGLAHILSISGTHFGLLLFILFGIFRLLVRLLPYNFLARLTIYLTPSQIAAVISIPFMVVYLGISSMSVPSIRAFIMITLFLFGLLIHRKGFWLNTLLFAAVVIILIQPDSILDLSFQLSFIAVLCIGLVTEQKSRSAEEQKNDNLKRNYFHNVTSGLLRFCASALKISLAATIGTAPLVAYHFHYLSLISPLTNLIITPIIGFIILPAALVASLIFLVFNVFPLQSIIDAVTAFVLGLIEYISHWKFVDVKIPAFPPILVFMFYLGILVYIVVGDRRRATDNSKNSSKNTITYSILHMALPIAISVVPIIVYAGIKTFEHKGMSITYLDVGQGDSSVVEFPDNKTVVIDTGKKGFQTAAFLKYRGIKKVDAVVLSHGQFDHAGGMWYLLENFKIYEIWDNGRLTYPDEFAEVRKRKLQRGDIIEGSGYRITALHPYDGFYSMNSDSNDENNDSVVLKIQGMRNSFLFTGDIEEESEEDLSHLDMYLRSNVLKIAHHGSRTSSSEVFLNAVLPEIAVISAGRKNLYGHPHHETLDALEGIRIFRTDRDGAIGIEELTDGRLKVKTWREFQFTEAKTLSDEVMNVKRLFWVW